jgi:RNA polymerase sigma-70 factor (ECF subfamily)
MANDPEGEARISRAISELQRGSNVEANSRCLFERFYPWVRRYFSRFGHSPPDCEDLAQETFAQVFRRLGSFRHEGRFESWLFAIAANLERNAGRDRRRAKRNALEVSLEAAREDESAPWEPVDPGVSASRAAYEKERREALAQGIQGLPPQMRQVLALRVERELKHREIAAVLRISVDTVKAHLFQARQRLRTVLGEDFGEWPEPEHDSV